MTMTGWPCTPRCWTPPTESAGPDMVGVTPLPQQKDKAGVGIGTRMTLVTALVAIVVFVVVFKVLSFGNLGDEPVWADLRIRHHRLHLHAVPAGLAATGPAHGGDRLPAHGGDHRARLQRARHRQDPGGLPDVDYPKELIRVVVVDDKSTDETLWRINAVAEEYPELTVIPQPVNQGKRHAMATGIAAADDVEVYVFIDSDSQVTPDAVKHHHGVLRRPESRCGGRAYRRRQRGAQRAHPDAGHAVLHRVPHLQERRGAVRFGHVLLGLLLGLPARRGGPRAGCLAGPDLPRPAVHLRRRPQPDQLRAAPLAGAVCARRAGVHQRARAPQAVPAPAVALEEVLAA